MKNGWMHELSKGRMVRMGSRVTHHGSCVGGWTDFFCIDEKLDGMDGWVGRWMGGLVSERVGGFLMDGRVIGWIFL